MGTIITHNPPYVRVFHNGFKLYENYMTYMPRVGDCVEFPTDAAVGAAHVEQVIVSVLNSLQWVVTRVSWELPSPSHAMGARVSLYVNTTGELSREKQAQYAYLLGLLHGQADMADRRAKAAEVSAN